MSSATRVAALLRDIKGIFEIEGAYFLVSISDEAAESLELGAIRTRDEFNSSFYTVVSIPSLNPEQCLGLLRKRLENYPRQVGYMLGVLGAGIPREVVRLAELIGVAVGEDMDVSDAVLHMVHEETDRFAKSMLDRVQPGRTSGAPHPFARREEPCPAEREKALIFDGFHGRIIPVD